MFTFSLLSLVLTKLTTVTLVKMVFSPEEQAVCVSWFIETRSDTQTRRNFLTSFNREPPSRPTIRQWHRKFMQTGSVLHQKGAGRPRTSEENVERVREAFHQSPKKSVRTASRQLQMPRSTVHKVLRKVLKFKAYKVQLLHEIKANDKPKRMEFAVYMLDRIVNEGAFLKNILFSDEATFHVSGLLNRHNCRIWGSEHPHEIREIERDSPKLNVWCGVMYERIVGPFFFAERTITGDIYLDMLTEYVIPQLEEFQPQIIFQQDGAPPHWNLNVRNHLDTVFPGRWIGRDGPIPWPPRSPDITPMDFSVWGFVKDTVYKTKVNNIAELRQKIIEAFQTIDPYQLQNTWRELEYRLETLRATNGEHIEIM